jgi:hypothetical protein
MNACFKKDVGSVKQKFTLKQFYSNFREFKANNHAILLTSELNHHDKVDRDCKYNTQYYITLFMHATQNTGQSLVEN